MRLAMMLNTIRYLERASENDSAPAPGYFQGGNIRFVVSPAYYPPCLNYPVLMMFFRFRFIGFRFRLVDGLIRMVGRRV